MSLKLQAGRVRPDVVFTRTKVAVFVDGCFWHCCPEHGKIPRANRSYWEPKLARNVERDRRNDTLLRHAGWQVLRFFEHEAVEQAAETIMQAVKLRS